MLAYLGSKLSPHIGMLKNGQLLCQAVPLARSGVQQYAPSELGLDLPERLVDVERPAEEVFSKSAMASFEGCVVTDGHPGSFVSPQNYKAYACGHVQFVREGEPLPNGDRVLVGDLVIGDKNLIDKITSGIVRDVSAGYDVEYIVADDGRVTQRKIKGNHIAIVPKGRASTTKIYDSAEGSMPQQHFTIEEALSKLATITDLLEKRRAQPQQATDHEAFLRSMAVGASPEAAEFCEAANALGRRLRGFGDCRPGLRKRAEDARTEEGDDAAEYAESMRALHRK